jgi:hypothetical protein
MLGLEGVEVLHPESGVAMIELHGEHDLVERADLQELIELLIIDNQTRRDRFQRDDLSSMRRSSTSLQKC